MAKIGRASKVFGQMKKEARQHCETYRVLPLLIVNHCIKLQ